MDDLGVPTFEETTICVACFLEMLKVMRLAVIVGVDEC